MILALTGAAESSTTTAVTLTGYLLQTSDSSLVLQTDTGEYIIEGCLPEDLIGFKVRLIGLIETGEDGVPYLMVDEFEQIHAVIGRPGASEGGGAVKPRPASLKGGKP
ncbi:MAG: hypothetical protein AB1641_17975 [Thermodesulfobacteriota bacterium]